MSDEFYNNVTIQLTGDDKSPVDTHLIEKSVYLQVAFSLNLARVIAPAADNINTENLGHLWEDVQPINDNYIFEIATILPYYLPDFDGKSEYCVKVDSTELVVSSRMLRCFFSNEGEDTDPLQYYLVHRRGLTSLLQQKRLTHVHPVPLRTFVAKRLSVIGTSAEQVVQHSFKLWIREFVENLSRLLDSIRAASPKDAKHVLPQFGTPFLPIFWISVRGDMGKIGVAQFAGDMPSAAFRSLSKIDADAVQRVHSFLSERATISVQDSAIALANTYLYYGYLGLALVQVCIACESVLAQTYESFLLSRGVSKTKYAEAERDITYSQLLNLHLAAVRDLSHFQNRESVLERLNWARKCRNDVVHKGELQQRVTVREVEQAIKAAGDLIQFLS